MRKMILLILIVSHFLNLSAWAADCALDLTPKQLRIIEQAEQDPDAKDFNYSVLTRGQQTLLILGDSDSMRFATGSALSRLKMASDDPKSLPIPRDGFLKSSLSSISDKWVLHRGGMCWTEIEVEPPKPPKIIEKGRPLLRVFAGLVAAASSFIFVKEACGGAVDTNALVTATGAAVVSAAANPRWGLIGLIDRQEYIVRLAKAVSGITDKKSVIYIPNRWFSDIDRLIREDGWVLAKGNHD